MPFAVASFFFARSIKMVSVVTASASHLIFPRYRLVPEVPVTALVAREDRQAMLYRSLLILRESGDVEADSAAVALPAIHVASVCCVHGSVLLAFVIAKEPNQTG
jgi:hypothetical protein